MQNHIIVSFLVVNMDQLDLLAYILLAGVFLSVRPFLSNSVLLLDEHTLHPCSSSLRANLRRGKDENSFGTEESRIPLELILFNALITSQRFANTLKNLPSFISSSSSGHHHPSPPTSPKNTTVRMTAPHRYPARRWPTQGP